MIRAGLRNNPFSAARFAPGAVPWRSAEPGEIARLFTRASARGARHQILGAHGSGKSTLLAHLEAHGRRAGASVLRFRGSRGFDAAEIVAVARRPEPRVLLVDEVEELGALRFAALRALARLSRAALVVTAHRDHGFATLARCRADARTARYVVEHLAGACAPSLDELDARLARHRGNLREVLFELYDEAEAAFVARA